VSEDHAVKNTITTNPVERGGEIADHIRTDAAEFSIVGFVSNSDQYNAITSGGLEWSYAFKKFVSKRPPMDRAAYAYNELYRIASGEDGRKTMTIVTPYRVYRNMLITELSAPRNAETFDSIEFTLKFRHVRMANSQVVKTENIGAMPNKKKPNATAGGQEKGKAGTGATAAATQNLGEVQPHNSVLATGDDFWKILTGGG
jgi:hypothetical protein